MKESATVVGLTGIIGSGKSVVADIFRELGAEIIDTDLIAHELTARGGAAIAKIASALGEEFITQDGELDRKKMRNLIFSNDFARTSLENILHELIYDQVVLELNQVKSKIVILVVPLLFKVQKFLQIVDYTLFIDCDEPTIFERVRKRSNLTDEVIKNILLAQTPRENQLKLADFVIENNGSATQLKLKVTELYNKLVQK